MYLRIKGKKIPIYEYNTLKERLKTFRFVLEPIDYGIKLTKKKLASTDFFCQIVDICFTDKEDIIIALYENVKSEKRILKLKAYNLYYLPIGSCSKMNIGDKIPIKKK